MFSTILARFWVCLWNSPVMSVDPTTHIYEITEKSSQVVECDKTETNMTRISGSNDLLNVTQKVQPSPLPWIAATSCHVHHTYTQVLNIVQTNERIVPSLKILIQDARSKPCTFKEQKLNLLLQLMRPGSAGLETPNQRHRESVSTDESQGHENAKSWRIFRVSLCIWHIPEPIKTAQYTWRLAYTNHWIHHFHEAHGATSWQAFLLTTCGNFQMSSLHKHMTYFKGHLTNNR